MVTVLAPDISETLVRAFRAAFLLTGSLERAENAVLAGIGAVGHNEAVERSLVAKTAEGIVRHRQWFEQRVSTQGSLLPEELQRVFLLAPGSRDCILLRVLCRVPAKTCAEILGLSLTEFEETLCDALEQLAGLKASGSVPDVKGALL
jgi:hypothetical protein